MFFTMLDTLGKYFFKPKQKTALRGGNILL